MKFFDDVDFVVDENIWGHRLYDEQLPHLIFLEFLGVLEAHRHQPLVDTGDQIRYKPQRQMRLRGVLFNNPYLDMIAASKTKSNDAKWGEWLKVYSEAAATQDDMAYLKSVFTSFDDFSRVVELLRTSAFEINSNKRWSSKFVFPFGPDAIYEDLRVESKGESNDRRFFARTGEILYLMLCRADRKDELAHLLVERLLDTQAPLNRLVKAIQGERQLAPQDKDIGYLPLQTHPRFDKLCHDWIHILKQDIPAYDAIQYLMASAGLNMMLYFLERSQDLILKDQPIHIVCEIVSKDRTKVRALSADSYQHNQNLSKQAIAIEVQSVQDTAGWVAAANADYPNVEFVKLMQARFQWPAPKEESQSWSAEKLVKELLDKAQLRHGKHVAKVHSSWSKAIGLSSRRLSRSTRYAPNDHFLKALVIMIVDQRMQFDEFLAVAYQRYGLVIGEAQGKDLIQSDQVDQEALSRNSDYLSSRLSGLGLVRQLSDGCAFVENPFSVQEDSLANK